MKTYWSAFLSLFFLTILTGCGNEQFGTGGQTLNSLTPGVSTFSAEACSNFTLIKPKVDVVYVVDNSASSYYLSSDIKAALKNTVDSLSKDFDYRVIGTPLIQTAGGNNDFQVMTNSADLAGIPAAPKRIDYSSDFSFFANPAGGGFERGLNRVYSFVNAHRGSLIRNNAYTLIVLISNGRDADIEAQSPYGNGESIYNASAFTAALNNLRSMKVSLNAEQFRMISVTAHTSCKTGWFSSNKSYVQMSKELYNSSGATDQSSNPTPDAYNLCLGGTNQIFSSINNAVKQVVIAHGYRHWPIKFAEGNPTVSLNDVKVTKVTTSGRTELIKDVDWTYRSDITTPLNLNIRETPTAGEPVYGQHFIRFTNLLNYPDCVLVSSVSQTEYFNYVVLPRKPIVPGVVIKINGVAIPATALNLAPSQTFQTVNIKSSPTNTPPVMRGGYPVLITDPAYYYKSGDNIESLYTPAGI